MTLKLLFAAQEEDIDREESMDVQKLLRRISGCSWVLRDHDGDVILHSRRSFADAKDRNECFLFVCLMWAIESIEWHRVERVTIAAEVNHLINAIEAILQSAE